MIHLWVAWWECRNKTRPRAFVIWRKKHQRSLWNSRRFKGEIHEFSFALSLSSETHKRKIFKRAIKNGAEFVSYAKDTGSYTPHHATLSISPSDPPCLVNYILVLLQFSLKATSAATLLHNMQTIGCQVALWVM